MIKWSLNCSPIIQGHFQKGNCRSRCRSRLILTITLVSTKTFFRRFQKFIIIVIFDISYWHHSTLHNYYQTILNLNMFLIVCQFSWLQVALSLSCFHQFHVCILCKEGAKWNFFPKKKKIINYKINWDSSSSSKATLQYETILHFYSS